MLCSLRLDQPERHRRRSVSLAKKAAALLAGSRAPRADASVLASQPRSSSRSSLVRPSRLPSSISAWRTQRRNDSGAIPSSPATSRNGRPLTRQSRTASCLNSGEKRFPFATIDSLPDACASIVRVSTKAGQLHNNTLRRSRHPRPLRTTHQRTCSVMLSTKATPQMDAREGAAGDTESGLERERG